MRRLLIAGADEAAMACVQQLSKLKHQFSITVLRCSAEPAPAGTGEHGLDDRSLEKLGLERLGVELRPGVCVEAIDRYAKVVRGCDGSRTTFDTLILAAGSANPVLARAAGLEVRAGVVLNDFLQTSDAHVYALGDGAEHRGLMYQDSETIQEQARVLVAHLTGYVPAPFQGTGASAGLANLSAAVTACVALPAASAGSGPRSEVQTPEPEGQPALVGVV